MSCDSADAEDIFDAIADSAKAPPIDDLTEEDRIADEGFVVGEYEAAASRHTWQSTSEDTTRGIGIVPPLEIRKENVKWRVGERCSALFSEDRVEYPAVVRLVKEWKRACVVEFDGYGNEEEVGWGDMKKKEAKIRMAKKRKI